MLTVTIAGTRQGTGKTTTAVNLAAELAALGARVVLQDLDPNGAATAALGQQPVPDPWQAPPVTVASEGSGSLRLGPAGRPLAGARGHDVRVLIERWRGEADVVVIDTPSAAASVTTAAVEAADLLLTTIDPRGGPGDVRDAARMQWMLSGEPRHLRALLVRVPESGGGALRDRIAEAHPTALLRAEIPPAAVSMDPRPVIFRDAAPGSPSAAAYHRLAREVLRVLGAEHVASVAA